MAQHEAEPRVDRRHQVVADLLENITALPTTATIPLKLLQLQRSRSSSLAQFADILAADPCLCGKVLSLANSAWFSPPRAITKLSEAIGMIGLRNLIPLVLASAMAGIYDGLALKASLRKQLWEASLLKGVAARECARHEAPEMMEEAFICGLIQDLALPVLFVSDRVSWQQLDEILDAGDNDAEQQERALFGKSHAELSAFLVMRFELPEFYQNTTRAHHDESALSEATGDRGLTRCLTMAALFPHRWVGQIWDCRHLVNYLLPDGTIREQAISSVDLMDTIEREFSALRDLMDESPDLESSIPRLMQEVSAELARGIESLIGESNTMISVYETVESQLRQRIQKLEVKATQSDHDALTGCLNRRGLAQRARGFFRRAREVRAGCLVGFLDIDNFKEVNDRFGHPTGDKALRAVAKSLSAFAERRGLVSRFGGDEFVFMVLTENRDKANDLIERLLGLLDDISITQEEEAIRVTTSLGLLWIGKPEGIGSFKRVLGQADRFMYEAKRTEGARYVFGEFRPPHGDLVDGG